MLDLNRINPLLKCFDLKKLFIDELGWDHTKSADLAVAVDSTNYRLTADAGPLSFREMERDRAGRGKPWCRASSRASGSSHEFYAAQLRHPRLRAGDLARNQTGVKHA